MRWVYYGISVVATALACLLWLFVFGVLPRAGSVPAAAPVVAAPLPGRLPVPPKLRPAVVSRDGQRERFFCVAGYVARQTGNSVETLLVENKPVKCP